MNTDNEPIDEGDEEIVDETPIPDEATTFAAGVLARLHADGPQELQPAPAGGKDDLGQDLVPYRCAKCGVLDHVNPQLAEVYGVRRMWCLPCTNPHLWKWRADDDGSRFLLPDVTGKKPPSRLGEMERRELELRHRELIELGDRKRYLTECVATMSLELGTIEPRLAELRAVIVPAAQAALLAIETDPKLEQRQKSADIVAEINRIIKSKRAAATAPSGQRTYGKEHKPPAVVGQTFVPCACASCQANDAKRKGGENVGGK